LKMLRGNIVSKDFFPKGMPCQNTSLFNPKKFEIE
jgi:hypothetical protein